MTEEDRLRTLLREAVPDPEYGTDRARDARQRAARHRKKLALVSVACAALLVAAIGVFVHPGGKSAQPPVGPSTNSPNDRAADALVCPPWPLESGWGDAKLPLGAVAVRLCAPQGVGVATFAGQWQAPDDLLTEHLDELVALINRQDRADPQGGCTADAGPGFVLVLAYPDGSTHTVSGERFGCGYVRYGDTTRLGAAEVWTQMVTFWKDQRAHISPEGVDTAAPRCDQIGELYGSEGIPFSPLSRWDEAVEARVCLARVGIEGPAGWKGRQVPAQLLRQLTASFVADRQRMGGPGCPATTPTHTYAIVGTTAWGDHVIVQSDCLSVWPGSTPAETWVPPTDVVAELTALLPGSDG